MAESVFLVSVMDELIHVIVLQVSVSNAAIIQLVKNVIYVVLVTMETQW